jgi:hypothetical protein
MYLQFTSKIVNQFYWRTISIELIYLYFKEKIQQIPF